MKWIYKTHIYTDNLLFFTDCGIPNKVKNKIKREGSPSYIGEYPWQVGYRLFSKLVQNAKNFPISGWNNV